MPQGSVVSKPCFSQLEGIPTVGSSGFWGSFWGGYHFVKHAREVVKEGYDKYHGRAFKVRMPYRWVIIATGPDLVNDIKRAPDDMMSFDEAVNDVSAQV
ncbi:hypothetical protein K435DRAFT_703392 [Dendrothele bispora CBS 962.96]|uniref:Uncharacterized protein n=1 Tax=Dendrothele bispora (strain CBS 962.96) TaxID=1314807 RepID=A0A4S8KN93_DENBC|nr:hypothetical protein K435DRAFT_703392 [Dendrothele bispora CBS 962.96]